MPHSSMLWDKVLLGIYHLGNWGHGIFSTALFDHICVDFSQINCMKKKQVLHGWNLWKGL